jgi:coenzyme F420-reducing hydrogenase beta subunit
MSDPAKKYAGEHKYNVCTQVVAKRLCIGCGMCVAVCPRNVLKIMFNQLGEYNPVEVTDTCLNKCSLCLQVCPFYCKNENENFLGKKYYEGVPGIQHSDFVGYYYQSFVGYSKVAMQRWDGASGGLATWILETLLRKQLVDQVICVGTSHAGDRHFEFKICSSAEKVRECSKSCYYPVEMSEVLSLVLKSNQRFAIIGTPCFCKAVRLAQSRLPRLARNIQYVIGLVCGQTKSRFFAEYLCARCGGDYNQMASIRFRVKDKKYPASDYATEYRWHNGSSTERIFWSEGMGKIWSSGCFTPRACGNCDDIFAECADATFMDAWLPEFSKDSEGTSIVLVRTREIYRIFREGLANSQLHLDDLPVKSVIRSQIAGIQKKRSYLPFRREYYRKKGESFAYKRTFKKQNLWPLGHKGIATTWAQIAEKSQQVWRDARGNADVFESQLQPFFAKLEAERRKSRWFRVLNGLYRRIMVRIK